MYIIIWEIFQLVCMNMEIPGMGGGRRRRTLDMHKGKVIMTDIKSLSEQEGGVPGRVSGCLGAEGAHFIPLTRRAKSEDAGSRDVQI